MESNKLIAEFMELETLDGCYFEHLTQEGNKELTHHMLLQYHTSWDWLMAVVKKIEDMGCEIVTTNGECTISGPNDYYEETIGKSRRGSTYQAVVEFINQYNKNK